MRRLLYETQRFGLRRVAMMVALARRWRPVRSNKGLGLSIPERRLLFTSTEG